MRTLRTRILAIVVGVAGCSVPVEPTTPSPTEDLRTCRVSEEGVPLMTVAELYEEARKHEEAADREAVRAHEVESGGLTSNCIDERITEQSTSGTEELTPGPQCWRVSTQDSWMHRRLAADLRAEADVCREAARAAATTRR
jgi:hypothetical protein